MTASIQKTALDQAEQFAYSVLSNHDRAKEAQGAQPGVVHHYHHYDWWATPSRGYFWTRNDCCPASDTSRSKKDHTAAIVAAATIVLLATSYSVGGDWALSSKAARLQDDLQEKKFYLLEAGELEGSQLQTVLDLEEKMADSMRSEARTGLLTKTALLVSSIAVGAGAVLSAPAVLSAGGVAGAATSAVLLMRKGYIDSDTALKEQALQLLEAVEGARRA